MFVLLLNWQNNNLLAQGTSLQRMNKNSEFVTLHGVCRNKGFVKMEVVN